MKILKFNPRKSKAQAIVEFALVLPVLLLVVYGLIEAGRLLFIYSFVTNAARQAARWGSTTGIGPHGVSRYLDCDGIRDEAERVDFLNSFNAYDPADFVIEYDRPASGTPDPGAYYTCTGSVAGITAQTGDRITVRVNADFTPIVPLVPFDPFTINAESSRTLLLSISIQPEKEDTVTLITSDAPDPSEVNQPVTVSVTVNSIAATPTTPTGTVEITGADTNCNITLSSGSGSCVVYFTTFTGPGDSETRTLTATYTGDSTHNPSSDTENHTVEKASTEIVITADTPDPSLPGATVTVEVDVTSVNPWGGTPSGTVTITGGDGSVPTCTINLSGGSGNCNINFSTAAIKTITATYNGDGTHSTSVDTESHDVIPPGVTVTTINSDSPDPSGIGQTVIVTFAVTSSSTPTGTVTITGQDQGCAAPVTLVGGTGSCQVIFNSVGSKTLTATYTPDTSLFSGSSDTELHVVELSPASFDSFIDNPDPSDVGQAVNVTVTVSGGSTTPTGTVTITGPDTSGCTINLSGGTGTCSLSFTATGSKTLTATYNGDSTHATSSDTESHTVTQPPVAGCNTTNITVGLLEQTSGAMTMTISNSLSTALQISNVTVQWNHDKGHQTGSDKTLILQSARLGSVFWTGNETGPTYTITPASTFIPPGVSTLVFNFHQAFDRWDNTESVTINLSTPGCEGVILFQNQHD